MPQLLTSSMRGLAKIKAMEDQVSKPDSNQLFTINITIVSGLFEISEWPYPYPLPIWVCFYSIFLLSFFQMLSKLKYNFIHKKVHLSGNREKKYEPKRNTKMDVKVISQSICPICQKLQNFTIFLQKSFEASSLDRIYMTKNWLE